MKQLLTEEQIQKVIYSLVNANQAPTQTNISHHLKTMQLGCGRRKIHLVRDKIKNQELYNEFNGQYHKQKIPDATSANLKAIQEAYQQLELINQETEAALRQRNLERNEEIAAVTNHYMDELSKTITQINHDFEMAIKQTTEQALLMTTNAVTTARENIQQLQTNNYLKG